MSGPQREIPLVANTAEGDIAGNELLVNVFPEKSTGGKYPFTLKGSPGLPFFLDLPTMPVKGLYSVKNRCFAVTETKFYEVMKDGTSVELGDVDFTGRVKMVSNGIQVVAVDGFKGYYYDASIGLVKQLTGDGWFPTRTVTYQDGYFLFERKDTGLYFISDLLSVFLNPLDFGSAEGQPDNISAVLSDHREVFLFGTDSIQVVYNSGDSDFPFDVNQGAFVEKGLGAIYSVAKQNNTIYFVGSDLMVYQMNGYIPQRISSHAVEEDLKIADLEDCFGYAYQELVHLFYVMTIPSINKTWCYDISTGAWHIRKDYLFGRHRSECVVFFDKKTLVGDFQSGRIYEMTSSYLTDDDQPIIREFILPTINNGREFLTISSFELDMTKGVTQGVDPIGTMQFSKDNGKTWSNEKFSTMGRLGEYLKRTKWNRLGAARQFQLRVRISAPVPIDIGGAYLEVD